MSSSFDIPQPWFPSLFTWEPVFNSKGEPKLGLRHRKGDDPREIYGAADSDQHKRNPIASLRWTFLNLALLEVPVGLARLPFRAIHLLMGDFVAPATAKARNEWLLKLQEWGLPPNRNQPPPSDVQRTLILAKWVMIELARNVGKLALCVLAIIPLEITALCGIFLNPYDAAFVFSQIEKWCAREIIPLFMTRKILGPHLQLSIGDFAAPCMQTKLVWMRRNFYRRYPCYDPGALSSLICSLDNQLAEKEAFLSKEGIDVTSLCDSIYRGKERGSPRKTCGCAQTELAPREQQVLHFFVNALKEIGQQIEHMEAARERNDPAFFESAKKCFKDTAGAIEESFPKH